MSVFYFSLHIEGLVINGLYLSYASNCGRIQLKRRSPSHVVYWLWWYLFWLSKHDYPSLALIWYVNYILITPPCKHQTPNFNTPKYLPVYPIMYFSVIYRASHWDPKLYVCFNIFLPITDLFYMWLWLKAVR